MRGKRLFGFLFASALTFGCSSVWAQVVITPLGSNAGEFCGTDRAMLFEDPSGVNILIQPGRTVNTSTDARLPDDVHVVLLDHAHVDHIGDRIDTAGVAPCGLTMTALAPLDIPNIAEIAAGKNSAVLVGGELVPWLRNRIGAAEGAGVGGCGASGLTNVTDVQRTDAQHACVDTLRPGASRELALDSGPTGVKVSTVQATHSNGISPTFIDGGDLGGGINGYGGTETGYVIRFSNGLSVYWSGDSGFFGDMALFSDYYDVNLFIPHIGDIFTMGPDEAAFATNHLVKPKTVIPQHANQGSTDGGDVVPGTRLESFIDQVNSAKVIVPLSGKAISCDGNAKCTQEP